MEDNLFEPLSAEARREYEQGQGDELQQNMRAVHSSSALACNELWYSGKKGCTTKAPTACVQTQTPAGANNCLNRCGATYFTVPCGSGNCPEHSYCTPDSRCSCIAGYTGKTCTGTVCSGTCSYPNWACVPTVTRAQPGSS